MKTCLITGGGSKFGRKITDQLLLAGYHVYLITGSDNYTDQSNLTTIKVDWHTVNLSDLRSIVRQLPKLDLIFFNHNSSALSQEKFTKNKIQNAKSWQQSYFVACQFPFYLIHTLPNNISETTKIGWMLSELIKNPKKDQVGFADYVGNKFTNSCIMKSFSCCYPAIFFGINPESVSCDTADPADDIQKAIDIVKLIDTTSDLNGQIYYSNGNLFDFYQD
jgi:hypothetical protein